MSALCWSLGCPCSPPSAQVARWTMELVPGQCLTAPFIPRFVPPGDAGSEDEAGAEEADVGHRPLSRGGTKQGVCAPRGPRLQWQWDSHSCRAAGVLGQGWQSWEMGPGA